MHVLVTGGAGFIGSHLAEALLARGDRVRILDNLDPTYDPAIKRRNVPTGAAFVEGDLLDLPPGILDGIDAVAHFAARAGVRPSLRDPATYARVNVVGTANLLAAMERSGIRRMVFASSSSVYGARPGEVFRESDATDRPASPYAASKRAAEGFCAASGLDVSVVRLFTVYGPRQRPEMAMQRFARQILAGEPVTLFGDGASVRDYTFVADAVAGLIRALDAADGFRVVNIAGGEAVRLDRVVTLLGTILDRPVRIERIADQPGDVPETRADLTVAREWLGWAPKVGIEAGLREFVGSLATGPGFG
jgi:UDP-glucuronate 4-epimerase